MRTPKRTSRKVMKAPQAHGSRSKISALGLTLALISGSASAYYCASVGNPMAAAKKICRRSLSVRGSSGMSACRTVPSITQR